MSDYPREFNCKDWSIWTTDAPILMYRFIPGIDDCSLLQKDEPKKKEEKKNADIDFSQKVMVNGTNTTQTPATTN